MTPEQLSPSLFWDVDVSTVELKLHKRWLLSRVLERGTWEDWQLLSNELGADEIKMLQPSLRLSPKSANFLKIWINKYCVC